MEELIGATLAGAGGAWLLAFINGRTHTVHRVANRLKGHRPARPMEYSGGREKLQKYLEERDRG